MVIIKNKLISLLLRVVISFVLIFSVIMTAAVSLQYRYQVSANQLLSNKSPSNERVLIIHVDNHWVSAYGDDKKIYTPLLTKELGAYQSHRYMGWHADYTLWQKGLELPFTLMYEVTYDKAIINENFYFNGGLTSHLLAREINITSDNSL